LHGEAHVIFVVALGADDELPRAIVDSAHCLGRVE
jgi:hypothetical protein